MRSLRFSRVRETASFMRSKRPGFLFFSSSRLPNRVWIISSSATSTSPHDAELARSMSIIRGLFRSLVCQDVPQQLWRDVSSAHNGYGFADGGELTAMEQRCGQGNRPAGLGD